MEDPTQEALLLIRENDRMSVIINGKQYVLISNPFVNSYQSNDNQVATSIETGTAIIYLDDGIEKIILQQNIDEAIETLADSGIEIEEGSVNSIDVAWLI
jgi:hypothetical protein